MQILKSSDSYFLISTDGPQHKKATSGMTDSSPRVSTGEGSDMHPALVLTLIDSKQTISLPTVNGGSPRWVPTTYVFIHSTHIYQVWAESWASNQSLNLQ